MYHYPGTYQSPKLPMDICSDPFFHQGLEPHFGLGIVPSDFHTNRIVPRLSDHDLMTGYRRPWALSRQASKENAAKHEHIGIDGFQACVDVHHFQPSEITVKTVENKIVVEATHEERGDGHGSVQRHFIRRYTLPKEYDMTTINSALSSDGVLTLKAPAPHMIAKGERLVPISHTNTPVHFSVRINKPI